MNQNGKMQRHPLTAQWLDHVLIYMVRKLHVNILVDPSHWLTLFPFHPSFLSSILSIASHFCIELQKELDAATPQLASNTAKSGWQIGNLRSW